MRFVGVSLLISILFLSGCASTSQGVGGDYRLDSSGGNGLVVLSTRMDDRCGMGMVPFSINYQDARSGKHAGFFLIKNMFVSYDFENPGGYFYARELPVGEYAFYQVSSSAPGWSGGYLKKPVKFNVAAGKAMYAGELTVTFECKEGEALIPQIAVSDQRKRDAKLFDERMENLSSRDLSVSIMRR